MSNHEPQAKRQTPAQPLVSRASLQWETAGTRAVGAPVPAASVRARLAGQKAKARLDPRCPALIRAGSGGVFAGVLVTVAVLLVGGPRDPLAVFTAAVVTVVVVTVVLAAWHFRARWGYDAMGWELRGQARLEERVAASLAPLDTAGWVLLHDRLIAAHRVAHLLVGPPGVILIYPYTVGRHAIACCQLRRARALIHSMLAWVLAVPLVLVRVRPLPHLSAATPNLQVSPREAEQVTACWARDELTARLRGRPTLDSWTVVVYAYYAVDHRPGDRAFTRSQRVGFGDLGVGLRTVLHAGLPAGLNRTAIAFLATEVDETCPPA